VKFLSRAASWLKEKAVAANEDGVPIPYIRDQHMNGGTLPGTMFALTWLVAILATIGKLTKYLGDVDDTTLLWLLGMTGGFWAIEALGKTVHISKDRIELGTAAEPKPEVTDDETKQT
jgi:hypothetical protein